MLVTALGLGLSLLAPSLDPGPTRIRYTMQGGEVLTELAEQYGTTAAALRGDNPGKLERGRILVLAATRLPPPRQRLKVTAAENDSAEPGSPWEPTTNASSACWLRSAMRRATQPTFTCDSGALRLNPSAETDPVSPPTALS